MKLAFATLGCPGWDLEKIVAEARKMGYDGVELRGQAGDHIGPEETPAARKKIKAMFRQAKLAVSDIMGYTNFVHTDHAQRQAAIETARKFIDVAADIDCPVLRIFAGDYHKQGLDLPAAIKRAAAGIAEVTPHAEKRGVKLALETHDAWCYGENLRALIDGVKSPAMGVCWDIANAYFNEPLEKTHAAIADRIFHVHFKDTRRTPEGKHKSVLVGAGEVDLPKAARLLHAGGYTGFLSFEWEKKWQPDIEEPEVAFPHFIRHVSALLEQLGIPRG